ncbi:MAG: M1 family metallopeptidase [Saprospiraceae bacterium]
MLLTKPSGVGLGVLILILFSIFSCNTLSSVSAPSDTTDAHPHSFSRPDEVKATHLDLDIKVDFDKKQIEGTAKWDIQIIKGDKLILDTWDLEIEKVTISEDGNAETSSSFSLGPEKEDLGRSLAISITPATKWVKVYYKTGQACPALLWLEPSQTLGKQLPLLFSQGQPNLTRSWIPCQDTPGVKFTYNAKVQVPAAMLCLMSANNPREKRADGQYNFTMENPVPAYLVAIAAGDLVYEQIGPRAGVYGEPAIAEQAYVEFNRVESFIEAAESIAGPYRWNGFDILVLPPSFPFGGMENPQLTFVTPTVVVGDRSMVSLIAHELAHSWSGNLVTNASWNDFWLNEGITTYLEWRIMEATEGKDLRDMIILNGLEDFKKEVAALGEDNMDTALKVDLKGRNPVVGMSSTAYEKGANFMLLVEQSVGREKMDAFLKKYFNDFAFKTITTEEFIAYLKTNLLNKYAPGLNVDEWVYQPGIPSNLPETKSEKFARLDEITSKINAWSSPTRTILSGLTAQEWVYFINKLPKELDNRTMKSLDLNFNFTSSNNAEIKAAWFALTIYNGYSENIMPQIKDFLHKVGRTKFLEPIYTSFVKRGFKEQALEIYISARPFYHSLAREKLDPVVGFTK